MKAGLTVRVRRVDGLPVVAIRALLLGGARAEEIPGQALLTGRLLGEGTRSRDWRRIADDAEARGMVLASFGAFELHGVSVDSLAQDWELALAWAAELLLEPAFPEERCRWLVRQTLGELESLADQPEVKTAWGFFDQLYAPHPKSRPLQGSAESLGRLVAADCAAVHQRARSWGAIVTVAGEIDEAAAERRVSELFAGLPAAGAPAPEPPLAVGRGRRRRRVRTGVPDQAHLFVGHPTVPRRHPDFAALELAAVILGAGSGLTGRIPGRIREQEGLAYTAQAQTVAGAGLDAGRLVAYVATSPATLEQAERGVAEEIRRMVEEGVTEEEVEEARAYLLGREPFGRETARQWAELLADAEVYGLPLDDPAWRQEQLTAPDRAEVEAAIRRHLHPDRLKVTVGLGRER